MVRATCREIIQRDVSAVIEGGSTTYFPALYAENERNPFINSIIGLRFPKDSDISKKIEKRIEITIDDGLLNEVKMGMEKYPNSLIMKDCHFIVPFVQFLKSEISFIEAKKKAVHRCLEYIDRQMKCFSTYPNIEWIEVDIKN